MALIGTPHIGGGFTSRALSAPIPWDDPGPAVASDDFLAAGTSSIGVWALGSGSTPTTLDVDVLQSQVPLPGHYIHVGVSPLHRPIVLSVVRAAQGGHLLGVAALPSGFTTLLSDPVGLQLDLDRGGGSRAALWRGSVPDEVVVLDQADMLKGNIVGSVMRIDGPIMSSLGPGPFEVVQMSFHEPQVALVASPRGVPERQVIVCLNLQTGSWTVVPDVHDVSVAASSDALVWSSAFDVTRMRWTRRQQVAFLSRQTRMGVDATRRSLYYVGPLATTPIALMSPQPGFDVAYPRVVRKTLVFSIAWPVPTGHPRMGRKTAVVAYDLAGLSSRKDVVVEVSDAALWSDTTALVELRAIWRRPTLAIAFFEKPTSTSAPTPYVRAGRIKLP